MAVVELGRGAVRRSLVLVLGVFVCAAAAAQDAPELRELPVYPLETPGHQLQVGVYEVQYPMDFAFLPQQLAEAAAAQPKGSPEAVVLTYLDLVMRERFQAVSSLFPPEAEQAKLVEAARFYHKVLSALPGGVSRLRLDRLWHYGPFRVALVEARGTGGAVRIVSISLEQREARYVRRDDWGRWQPVQALFWYMTRNVNKGLMGGHRARDLPIEISLRTSNGDPYPVIVSSSGAASSVGEPVEVATGGDSTTAAGAALAAFAAANAGEDAFRALWHGEERNEMAKGRLEGHRGRLAGTSKVRPLLTLDLGDFALHYYLRDGESEARALVLRRAEGRFWLTDDLYTNLEVFMTSAPVRERIRERFVSTGGA